MKVKRKNNFTIIEIMIVIAIMAGLAGVVYYNMSGSLQRGKIETTRLAIRKLEDILLYEYETGRASKEQIENDTIKVLENCGLVKDPNTLMIDAWGDRFVIKVINRSRGRACGVSVRSPSYDKYISDIDKAKLRASGNISEDDA